MIRAVICLLIIFFVITKPSAQNISGTLSFCQGSSTTLSVTGAPEDATFQWQRSTDGGLNWINIMPGGTDISYSVTLAAGYRVTVMGSPTSAVNVIMNQPPLPPDGPSPVIYCQYEPAVPLTAFATADNALLWYPAPVGGTGSRTAPIPQTKTAGTSEYYVSQDNRSGCESERTTIIIIIKPAPTLTAAYTNPASCTSNDGTITISGFMPGALYAFQYFRNGTSFTSVGTATASGTITITGLTPGLYTQISATLIISFTEFGCYSNVMGPFVLVAPGGPAAPTTTSNSPLCEGSTLNLAAQNSTTGVTYLWDGPGGFTSNVQSPVIPDITASMSGTYTVIALLNDCSSEPNTTTVVIDPPPSAPTAGSPVNYCQNDPPIPLTAVAATGNTLRWYTLSTGGTASTLAPTTVTGSGDTITYYVSQATAANCESPRTPIVVNVSPAIHVNAGFKSPTSCITPDGRITLSGLRGNTTYSVRYFKNGTPFTVALVSSERGFIDIAGLTAGLYTDISVTLNGCKSNLVGPYNLINPSPPATPKAGNASRLCAGGTIYLTAVTTTPGVWYAWTGPGGFTSALQNPSRINATTNMSGTYIVTLSLNGCNSAPASMEVLIDSPLTVTATNTGPVCSGTDLTFAALPSRQANIIYSWSGPNAYVSTLQNPVIPAVTSTVSGAYTVTASQLQNSCPAATAKTDVIVEQSPAITGSFTDLKVCSKASGSITISKLIPYALYSIHYTKDGSRTIIPNVTAGGNGQIELSSLTGGYYTDIYVTFKDCRSNSIGPFLLTETFVAPPAPTITANSPLCIGESLNLFASPLTGGVSYSWMGPDGFKSSLQNPVINQVTLAAGGSYTVTANLNGCLSSAGIINVLVGDFPYVNLGPDLSLAGGTQLVLSAAVNNAVSGDYLWTPATNLSCASCMSPTAFINSDITYVLTVKNVYNCSASDTLNIKVLCEKNQLFIPNAFTPNGDGTNDVFIIRSAAVVTVKHFRVFNKWGMKLFERTNFPSNNKTYGWDGKINGIMAGTDLFIYDAEVICENGRSYFYKGNVTLLR